MVASALLYGLKLIAARFPQWTIKREWLTVGLYVISLGLSLLWSGFVLPPLAPFSDPVTLISALFGWVNALLIALALPVSFATLIYNIFLKKIFDAGAVKLGWK
jgi:hypothetical protein